MGRDGRQPSVSRAAISAACSSPCSTRGCRPGGASRRAVRRRCARHPGRPRRRRARLGVEQPHLGVARDRRRAGCTAGWRSTTETVPSSSGSASARSANTSAGVSGAVAEVLLRPEKARGEFSTRSTRAWGTSVARASAMRPLPVPRSTPIGSGLARWPSASMATAPPPRSPAAARRPRPDSELERAERRPAGDVLQRLARGTALDGRSSTATASSAATTASGDRLRLHLPAAEPEHVPDEQLGVDVGRRTPAPASTPMPRRARAARCRRVRSRQLTAARVVSAPRRPAAPPRRPGCTTR